MTSLKNPPARKCDWRRCLRGQQLGAKRVYEDLLAMQVFATGARSSEHVSRTLRKKRSWTQDRT